MSNTYRLILCAAAVVAVGNAVCRATDPTVPPTAGRVLLLVNERTVEGDIVRVGDQYRVRHAVGETWVPGDKVLRLCADMNDAYRVLRGRTNLNDPDECLRLARWCHGHGLPAQALESASAAAKLDPTPQSEARHLVSALQRTAAAPTIPAAAAPGTAAALDVPELNTESSAVFATKVEPILMNACAGCHTANRGGSFKLTRSYDSTSASRLSLQQNLAAVLAQVNLQQPQDSKLLVKAITAHDPQARLAPLNNKQMAAYHTIEDWVQTTLANNPHLREHVPPPEAKAAPPQSPAARPASDGFATAQPAKAKATPVDEFDPLPFNRQGQTSEETKPR